MLNKEKRLTKEDFKGVYPKVFFRGNYVDIASLSIKSRKRKFACVISKKTIKKAVIRNKIRRRVYSLIEKLSIKNNELSFIVYPKKTSATAEYSLLKEEINKAFDTIQ